MSALSPAAQAVLDASTSVFWRPPIDVPALQKKSVAAALRAAVEAVIPTEYEKEWRDSRWHEYEKENPIGVKLLAIAAELEAQ